MGRYNFKNAVKLIGIPFLLSALVFGVVLTQQNTDLISRAGGYQQSTKYFKLIMSDNPEETFIVRVDDPEISGRIVSDLTEAKSLIFSGRVKKGDGGFNAKVGGYWNWHMDPDTVTVGQKSVYICDSRPSQVEADLSKWLGKTFCPSLALIEAVYDTPVLPSQ